MKAGRIVILFLLIANFIFAQKDQTFISLRNTGVESFQNVHPEYDGRGTIILVLDTGVDMGIDGLTTTSTGEVKVIDVQDFTGQGDINFYEAEKDDEDNVEYFINEDKNYKIAGADKLSLKAADDTYFIGLIEESLWKNSGSGVYDVNGNGTTDDKFYFVTFNAQQNGEKFWVVYFDLNANGTLADEKPIRNYKEKFDSFTFPNDKGLPDFTLALNIFPEEKKVSFYFDDGSHGTHCAGISAGNKIGNNELYGIAPGTKVMGLKLGNNNYAGGATVTESMKKAYLYADKISKERKEPCIINMSFGVGSEIEEHSDIEIFLNELVKDNPYLYISTSNGNEGPGISTTGVPASTSSIFSSGAVLAKEVGNDLYGTTLDKDIILHFSSRGGEVKKPDVVSPGACVSTVPNFSDGDIFWGTSMASPYSAGVMAVLLGAMKVEFPDVKIPSQFLYKVLRESATKMEGYDFIDQGGGLINIDAAYLLMKKYIQSGEINNFETYTISSFAPNMPNNSSSSLYIRDASYLTGAEKFSFQVGRNNIIDSEKFYRIYNLKSSSDWLTPIQKKIHLRNEQPTVVNVAIDPKILSEPGLHNAKIFAARADKSATPEFELMATIVIPYEFNSANNYNQYFENEKVMPGMLKRYYLKIPAGASNLSIQLNSSKKNYTSLRYYLHDQDGREKYFGTFEAKLDNGFRATQIDDLTPGVYEFVVLGQFTSSQESIYDLSFEIDGINILGHSFDDENKIKIVNYFDKIKPYNISVKELGYEKKYSIKLNGEKIYSIPFEINEGESKKEFEVSLSKEDFNKITDFSLLIYDQDGKAVQSEGFSYHSTTISVSKTKKESKENYRLDMIPGFANAPSEMEINIVEKTYFDNPEEISLKKNITFYPFIEEELTVNFSEPKIKNPNGTNYFTEIIFTLTQTKDVEFKKSINIKTKE